MWNTWLEHSDIKNTYKNKKLGKLLSGMQLRQAQHVLEKLGKMTNDENISL